MGFFHKRKLRNMLKKKKRRRNHKSSQNGIRVAAIRTPSWTAKKNGNFPECSKKKKLKFFISHPFSKTEWGLKDLLSENTDWLSVICISSHWHLEIRLKGSLLSNNYSFLHFTKELLAILALGQEHRLYIIGLEWIFSTFNPLM